MLALGDDACPDEAGPSSRDKALNGCPAHDRDGDGIRDDEDFCPDRPGVSAVLCQGRILPGHV